MIRAMTDYIDSPVLSTAREQLVACQMYGAEELARLHQVLLEKEAQLIHREELEQEITRQADSLTELEEQAAEMKESIKRTEVSLGTLDGQRAQLEDNLHRELLAHLQACSLEDAPAAISRALSEVTEKIAQMARLEQEFGEKLQKKQELNRNIPLMEQEMRMLEENTGKLKEELAGARSRQEELSGQLQTLRGRLPFPDQDGARQKITALQEELQALAATLEQAEKTVTDQQKALAAADAAIREQEDFLKSAQTADMEVLQQKSDELTRQRTETSEAQKTIHTRLVTNQTALQNICEKATDLEQSEKQYKWLQVLSDTVNGRLRDREKIALETYIQMTFFDRIIQRANLRLLVMSGGQYELKRRMEADNNRSQSGLELDVIDHYNGSERSVKSLSGGESFKASISLALGLSDEVQSAAGGIRLDTMFVDEGFGSLDEESLAQAIRALTGLTEGKRLVGIISHVTELKEKIEKQIVVTKEKTGGSRVEIVV